MHQAAGRGGDSAERGTRQARRWAEGRRRQPAFWLLKGTPRWQLVCPQREARPHLRATECGVTCSLNVKEFSSMSLAETDTKPNVYFIPDRP